MKRNWIRFASVATLLLLPLGALAQSFRAYVASYGNDANPCTVALPCRLLPAALNAIASGGEIWMLDSANFNSGTVIIAKSASILAVPGQIGSVVAFGGGPAVSIPIAVTVSLRNVLITNNVTNPGTFGVQTSGGTLNVEDALFSNLNSTAIHATGTADVNVVRTVFRNLGLNYAIYAQDGPHVTVANSQLIGTNGIGAFSLTPVTTVINVNDTSIVGGGNEGLFAYSSASSGIAKIFATRVTIERQGYALDAETYVSNATAYIVCSYCTVVNNSNPVFAFGSGGIIKSLGNNYIGDNTGPETGSLGPTPMR